jgi:hypothetical protein
MVAGEGDDRLGELGVGLVELISVAGLASFDEPHLLPVEVDNVAHDQSERGGLSFFLKELLHRDADGVLWARRLHASDITEHEEANSVSWIVDAKVSRIDCRGRVWLRQRLRCRGRMVPLELLAGCPALNAETTCHARAPKGRYLVCS